MTYHQGDIVNDGCMLVTSERQDCVSVSKVSICLCQGYTNEEAPLLLSYVPSCKTREYTMCRGSTRVSFIFGFCVYYIIKSKCQMMVQKFPQRTTVPCLASDA